MDVDRFDRELAGLEEQIRERRDQLVHAREMMAHATHALDRLEQDQRELRRMRDRASEVGASRDREGLGGSMVTMSHAAFAGGPGGCPPVRGDDRIGDGLPPVAVRAPLADEAPRVPPSPAARDDGRRLRPDPKGRAPRGFAKEVMRIAHRSIAEAGRPLNRRAIMDDLERSGTPMPVNGAAQKVSKILGRDPDLFRRKEGGYSLVSEALESELAAIAAETTPAMSPIT